ncbi:histidine phosphatase family protein [Nocardiopsis sp. NRRL B-16309]|uniref:histidine phosphatase family protein n=1 Tax=Nocardiopsis sp. NRRL B-16309 TaxID=1519494 RepID=UPI0006AFF780|nr:histidine phosphatase family protein [Nocardiopsis sp. NRRL B-16309]KOX19657.1 phosphoglycerate mutase [Nocardiopsis sp. NRRL B-16309]
MGELVLIRHGQTEWSRQRRHTGRTDLPLTAEGEAQAEALRPLLAKRDVGLVVTSPLTRAVRTAELAGLHETAVDPDLAEWDYGGYEGITTAEIQRDRPGWNLWRDGVPPGDAEHPGELVEQVGERADRVLALVTAELDAGGPDVVLVAHGHVLRVLTARWLGLPSSKGVLFRLDTGSLSTLSREHDRPVIASWNTGR